MNLPNKITILRTVLGPLFLITYLSGQVYISLMVLLFNLSGDILDGFLARKREEVTELGELLDPFVDFLFFIIVGLSFSLKGIKEINWFLIPLGFIILSFVLPSLKLKKFKTPHTKMKFLHTTCIYILTAMILLDIDFHFFFWITFTIFSIISF